VLPLRARIWLVSITAVSALITYTALRPNALANFGIGDLLVAFAFLALLTIIEYADVSLSVGSGSFAFTVSAPIMMAAAMHLGVLPGALIVFCGLTLDGILKQRATIKSATNISTYVLTITIAGMVYVEFADISVSPINSIENALVASVAALVFALMGSWIIAWIVSPVVGMSPLALWRSNFYASAIEFGTLPTLGGLIVVLAEENAVAVILILLPLLAPQLAYRTLQRAQRSIRDTIESLADAIERRDRYTSNHSTRVAGYTKAILAQLPEIPDALAQTIFAAARVHDVGKVGIRDAALLKPGPLTTEERQDIQMHAMIGADIVSRIPEYRLCASIIRHHHERWDGAGYPDGLIGDDIPIGARIIAIADGFDAMTSDRPYRRAMSAEAAIEEVQRSAGTQFDPKIVAAFERVMGVAPRRGLEPATVVTSPEISSDPSLVT
jgi:hypothetical protein